MTTIGLILLAWLVASIIAAPLIGRRLRRNSQAAPTIDELLGIDPDWTGPLSTDEYIQWVRGDEWERP